MQFSMDFEQKLPVTAQLGMAAAEKNADPFWKVVIAGCILAVARRQAKLTVDDVIAEIESVNEVRKKIGEPIVETHNLCALGPLMSRAGKDGVITSTNELKRSTRTEKNGNIHRVWRSNFYEGKA